MSEQVLDKSKYYTLNRSILTGRTHLMLHSGDICGRSCQNLTEVSQSHRGFVLNIPTSHLPSCQCLVCACGTKSNK